jgi:hypothetical protein
LPLKYAPGSSISNIQPQSFFVANLDVFGGNPPRPFTKKVSLLATDSKKDGSVHTACIGERRNTKHKRRKKERKKERDRVKSSVPIKLHGASVAVTKEVWHDHTSIASPT